MKKVWANIVQEIILGILTLGISIFKKGKKVHQRKYEDTLDVDHEEEKDKKK